ncbi:MAG: energy transducer TonB [Candidatus Acidiferrales bacterium]
MSHRRAIRILVVSWVVALCMSPAASAQQLPSPQSATPAQQTPAPSVAPLVPVYADSSAGLEKLMKDMLGLEKRGDTKALAPYLQSLVLPDPDAWFKSIFGDTVGTQLALSYEPTAKWLPQSMAATLKNLRQEGLADHFEVVDFNKPCAAPSFVSIQGDSETKALGLSAFKLLGFRKQHEPMYTVWFRKGRAVSAIAFFAYDEGAFRYIGKPEIPDSVAAQGPQSQVKSGAKVQAAKLIQRVDPVYPVAAKQAHVEGTILLSAEIGKDGSIQDLSYVSGPQVLAPGAMDAVRQWKYQPTMLNGTPVTVDTCITVIFNLGSR